MYIDLPTIITILVLVKSYVVVIFITWWLCKGRKEAKMLKKLLKELV